MLHILSRRGLVDFMGPGGLGAGGRLFSTSVTWWCQQCVEEWHEAESDRNLSNWMPTGCNRMQLVSVTTFLFSHVFTCFHMYSRMAGYGNESSGFRSTISMVSGSMFLALRSTSHILTWCGSSSASIKAVFYKSFHLGILEHWIFRASWCVTSSHPLHFFSWLSETMTHRSFSQGARQRFHYGETRPTVHRTALDQATLLNLRSASKDAKLWNGWRLDLEDFHGIFW